MSKKTTFRDLHRLLGRFGFKQRQLEGPYGPYIVFEHDATGAFQAFRGHRPTERVDPMTLAAVRMTLVGNGFLERDDFETALQAAATDGKAKAKRK